MTTIPRPDQRLTLPRGLLAAFVAVVLIPSALLIALGLRLLEQDRVLEDRRRRELAEGAIEKAAANILKDISTLQRRLGEGRPWRATELGSDAAVLIDGVGPLIFQPYIRPLPEPPSDSFAEADRAEFLSGDVSKASALNGALAQSPAPPIRAGALLRLARLHQKAGRLDQALAAWDSLGQISGVALAGEPVGLVARRARCRALEQAGRTAALREEAHRLLADLHAARWPLARDLYTLAAAQARQWLGREAQALAHRVAQAEAASVLWTQRKGVEGSLCHGDYTMIWHDDHALIAGPSFRGARWEAPWHVRLTCAGQSQSAAVQRLTTVTGLPWVIGGDVDIRPLPEFQARRAALFSALPALLVLLTAVAYFAWRAVDRELGVARLQSDFVAAVSHEFRTPLTTLRQFNEMLIDEPDLPPDARMRYFKAQARATGRLNRLVETLLDFGRMEAGRRPYILQPLDGAALVREVVSEFCAEPVANGYAIACVTPDRPMPVSADREALSRAIWNLLDNAVKYSPDHREIRAEAAFVPDGFAFRVSDRGIGIPQEEQPRLFQKFVRGGSTRQRGIPGTGIGLAMVRHIAEAHGGRVEMQSVENQGSTFSIVLPGREPHGAHSDRRG